MAAPTDDGSQKGPLNLGLPFTDVDESETQGSTMPSGGTEAETEAKLFHAPLDLSMIAASAWLPGDRVTHEYDDWFYSVTHPPLTPPPNCA